LNEIITSVEVARNARSAADRDRSLAQNLRTELSRRLEKIEDERQLEISKARDQAAAELEDLQREMDEIRRELIRARQPVEALKRSRTRHLNSRKRWRKGCPAIPCLLTAGAVH